MASVNVQCVYVYKCVLCVCVNALVFTCMCIYVRVFLFFSFISRLSLNNLQLLRYCKTNLPPWVTLYGYYQVLFKVSLNLSMTFFLLFEVMINCQFIILHYFKHSITALAYWVARSPMARDTRVQSQVESFHRFKKWYLMSSCLTLNIIRYVSRVKWRNSRKGVAHFPKPWCSSYWKGNLRITLDYGYQIYL